MTAETAEPPRTLVIVNPASAGGRTGRRWPALSAALDLEHVRYDTEFTGAPHHATALTRSALTSGYERVVAVGGDGTLNEVVNGFFTPEGDPLKREAILALLPSGTGGDFRRTVGLPIQPAALARILAANATRRIDAGRINYDDPATPPRQFINIADCGVGGEVVARVNRSRYKGGGIRGTAVFLGVSLTAISRFGGRPVRLTIDGVTSELEIGNVVIANGRCFGGGMRVAPGAELDDGEFSVVVLPAMGRVRALLATPSVYRGTHIRRPGVLVSSGATVRVEPLDSRPLLFDIEGEQIGQAPATLTCLPGVLRFCVRSVGPNLPDLLVNSG